MRSRNKRPRRFINATPGIGIGFGGARIWTPASIPGLATWLEGRDVPAVLTRAVQPDNTNSDFATWTGTNPDATPTGWVKNPGTGTTANHIEQNGDACRLVSDGSTVQVFRSSGITGNRYAQSTRVTTVVSGGVKDLYGVNNMTAPGTYIAEFTAVSAVLGINRYSGLGNDVTFTDLEFENLSRTRWTPTAGSLGGYLSQATAVYQPWWDASLFGGAGGLRGDGDGIDSSLAASVFTFLHNGSGGGGAMAVVVTDLSHASTPFATCTAATASIGLNFDINTNGSITTKVCNGSGTAYASSRTSAAGVVVVDTPFVLSWDVVSGTDGVVVYVNGVAVTTGTLASPNAGAPDLTAKLLSPVDGSAVALEGAVRDPVLVASWTAAERQATEQYIATLAGITLP